MAYLILAYPVLEKNDFQLIQSCRKNNDKFYSVVDPHFTIVFPVINLTVESFISEIKEKSQDRKKIDFAIRCATVNKDTFSDYFYTFLVPDEGFSDIIKLHDKLYSDLLADNLRLDLDFIPHITIANSKDKLHCKQMVDEWNSREFCINGRIDHLTVVDYSNNTIIKLKEIKLKT